MWLHMLYISVILVLVLFCLIFRSQNGSEVFRLLQVFVLFAAMDLQHLSPRLEVVVFFSKGKALKKIAVQVCYIHTERQVLYTGLFHNAQNLQFKSRYCSTMY